MENIGSFISKSGRVKFTTDIPPLDDLLAKKNIKKVWYMFVTLVRLILKASTF